ncbi:DotU family type IV/VI secretion system protein [Pandoraea oxalativorans]|uniref:Type IV / VI secretion system DotU domain-containing protein n=1 Tax=Pandoraea oxalativorans TaxID=573737 RepID=A0A0E3YER6_9BURK|nr:DotU family type IV/VI secretion system protein [Pandoraea oxalativorans]AKC72072.2 hypothetical protein MB84_02285 [Pandoraea oxalativorans]
MNAVLKESRDPVAGGRAKSNAGIDDAASVSLRALLCDTALLVTTISAGGVVTNAAVLRERCEALLDSLDAKLATHGVEGQHYDDVRVAQCALLDETVLHHLKAHDREAWELAPLQVTRFGIHDAGERVFERLDVYMQADGTSAGVLEFYQALLRLGFVGRYALLGDARRRDLIKSLDARIEALGPTVEPSFVVQQSARRFSDIWHRISPWTIAGLTCVVAVLVWGAWDRALTLELQRIEAMSGMTPPASGTSVSTPAVKVSHQ